MLARMVLAALHSDSGHDLVSAAFDCVQDRTAGLSANGRRALKVKA